jgi:DNA primase
VGGRIPDEIIDTVRDRTDIVQVVSAHIALRRVGANFVGLCPFHGEKTPSFNVSPERQTFHCFGCGVGGNVFTFLMRVEGRAFPEVIERLAREQGIELPRRADTPAEARARSERERLLKATAAAREYFRARLQSSPHAQAYLAERGVSEATIERYGIGYAEDAWSGLADHLGREGFAGALCARAGLLIERRGSGHYDRFRHRILFPIEDLNGNTVGFGGRALGGGQTAGDDAKYLNSPETPLYDKGRMLFGLGQAREAIRREGRAIVVEGYFDAILLAQAGLENVVAPCGTALTPGQVRVLRRFTRDLVTAFDSDEAGRRATERAMHLFIEEGVQGLGLALPEGMDPDDLIRQEGPEALRDRLQRARPLLESWVVERTEGVRSFAERARRATAVGSVLRKIESPIERDLYVRLAAERLGVEEGLMRETLRGESAAPGGAAPAEEGGAAAGGGPAGEDAGDPMAQKIARAEEELLAQLFRAPELLGDPDVMDALSQFRSPAASATARVLQEAGTCNPAVLVDRADDPAVGSLVSRLASREPPMDRRPPRELFRAGAWHLGRLRLERAIRELSREMNECQRRGESPADLLRRKVTLTRELERYKGMGPEEAPSGSRS